MVRSSHIRNKRNHLVSSGSTRGAFVFSDTPPSSQDGKEKKDDHHFHFRHDQRQEKIQQPNRHPASHVDLNGMNAEQGQLNSHRHHHQRASQYPSSFKPSLDEEPTIGRNTRQHEFAQFKQSTENFTDASTLSPKSSLTNTDVRSSSLLGQNFISSVVSRGDQDEFSQQRSEIAAFSSQAIQQLPKQYGTLPPPQQNQQPQLHQIHPLLQQKQPQQEHPLKQTKLESHQKTNNSQILTSASFDHQKPNDHMTCKEFIVNGWLWLWHTTVFDKENPEFSSLHQFTWAVILGTIMGFITAFWEIFIDYCVELVWVKTPALLLHWGIFTDLDGYFPLPHYVWICPSIFGGVSTQYMFSALFSPEKHFETQLYQKLFHFFY